MRAGEPGGQQEQSQDELGPCCERGHGAPWLSVLGDRKKLNVPLALPSMHQVRDKALKHPSCPFHSSDVLKAARHKHKPQQSCHGAAIAREPLLSPRRGKVPLHAGQ